MSLFNLEVVGERLKEERKRLGFSRQAEMAKVLDMPERTYWEREGGKVAPDAELLAGICELGGDVTYIVSGTRTPLKARQDRATYTPAEELATELSRMKLSASDADLLMALAVRLSSK